MGKGWIAACLCCLALVVGSLASGCGSSDDGSSTPGSSSAQSTSATATTADGAVTKTKNGEKEVSEVKAVAKRLKPTIVVPSGPPPTKLVVNDLEEGTGAPVQYGDVVETNYLGVLYKSGVEFENSYDPKSPFPWRVGGGEVIKGWEQGVVGMKVGGRRELIIPPKLGFKPNQRPTIPPDETIVYVIDLIKTEVGPDTPKPPPDGSTAAKEVGGGEG